MAETTLNEGMAKGKCPRVEEMKNILNELCGEIDDCAGVADMLTAYIVGCDLPEKQREAHLLSILSILSRSLHEMTQKAAEGCA